MGLSWIKDFLSMNRQDLKDAITFLFIAVLFFISASDSFFLFVAFILIYLFGSLMAILGIGAFAKWIFGKNKKKSNEA